MPRKNANKSALYSGVLRVVSGGQTGVDRAALDAALEADVPIGGWCPRGRRSEAGLIPREYPLQETEARSYAVRTEWNVRDSDGTLILTMGEISSGTRLTLNFARQLLKPVKVVHLQPDSGQSLFSDQNSLNEQMESVVEWLIAHRICILNVAGPRGSSHKDVYGEAKAFIEQLLKRPKAS